MRVARGARDHDAVPAHQRNRGIGAEVDAVVKAREIIRRHTGDDDAGQAAVGTHDGPRELHRPQAGDAALARLADGELVAPAAVQGGAHVVAVAQVDRGGELAGAREHGHAARVGNDHVDQQLALQMGIQLGDDGPELGRIAQPAQAQLAERQVDRGHGRAHLLGKGMRQILDVAGAFLVRGIAQLDLGAMDRQPGQRQRERQEHGETQQHAAMEIGARGADKTQRGVELVGHGRVRPGKLKAAGRELRKIPCKFYS